MATFSGQGHDDKVSPYKEVALKALRALHWSLAITTVSLSMLHLTSEAVQHSAAAKSPAAQTSPSKAKQQLAEQASSEASAEVSATAALFKTDAAHSKLKAEIDETHSVIGKTQLQLTSRAMCMTSRILLCNCTMHLSNSRHVSSAWHLDFALSAYGSSSPVRQL